MLKIDPTLPDWIRNYAYPGAIEVDGTLTDENAFWFLLTACCPLIFQSYAILLHPFKVNWKLKQEIDTGLTVNLDKNKADFKRVSWKDFFAYYGKSFDINSAYTTQEELRKVFAENNNWPPYLYYPGQDNYEDVEIIIKELIGIYVDQLVNYYYFLENTKVWDNGDIIYEGYLSEFEKLRQQDDIDDTPNSIFPLTKEWCMLSDVDLPFTYIGGTTELINKITRNKKLEIFKLEPIFKEKA
jgi:hypothetical protein